MFAHESYFFPTRCASSSGVKKHPAWRTPKASKLLAHESQRSSIMILIQSDSSQAGFFDMKHVYAALGCGLHFYTSVSLKLTSDWNKQHDYINESQAYTV